MAVAVLVCDTLRTARLQLLADAVVSRHQLPYRRLTADSVLDFFSQRYQVAAPYLVHPTYRRQSRSTLLQQSM